MEGIFKANKEDIEDQIGTNLTGLIKTTKIFLPLLLKRNKAVIINITSAAGKQAYGDLIVYCATKFGVRGFSQALAQELPKKIKIYSINPGLTSTQMTKFQGVNPRKVADIIVKAAEERIKVDSSRDIDVWEFVWGENNLNFSELNILIKNVKRFYNGRN